MDAAAQPMDRIHVYYATNRRHRGLDRWQPTGYGIEPSKDGTENLRFGMVTLPCDGRKVAECLDCGTANDDIRQCIDGLAPDSQDRIREPVRHGWPNVWRLVGA